MPFFNKDKIPAIIPISEEEQHTIVKEYNDNVEKKLEQIPLVPRNLINGWPLLQVSLLSPDPSATGEIKYIPAIGGDKCHNFHVSAFSFAKLLTTIPGQKEITLANGTSIEPKEFDILLKYQQEIIDGYTMWHKIAMIKIKFGDAGYYGKQLEIQGKAEILSAPLENAAFKFAVPDGEVPNIAIGYTDSAPLTENEIKKHLNPKGAIFFNNQIYIDLGLFLDELKTIYKVDRPYGDYYTAAQIKKHEERVLEEYRGQVDSLKDHLKIIFKIDEFQELKKLNPNFKSSLQASSIQNQTEVRRSTEIETKNATSKITETIPDTKIDTPKIEITTAKQAENPALQAEVKRLVDLVKTMEDMYANLLHGHTNKNKIAKLKNNIINISKENINDKEKLSRMEKMFVSAFNEAKRNYKTHRLFFKNNNDFINRLKDIDGTRFHYPRMLALILKGHYARCENLNLPVDTKVYNQVVDIPIHNKYEINANFLQNEPSLSGLKISPKA